METNKKINVITVLLIIVAIVMIFLGIQSKILPPALTGIGFILIAWALPELKKK